MQGQNWETAGNLKRSDYFSRELKKAFESELMAQRFARSIDVPYGRTVDIFSLGQFVVEEFEEGQTPTYQNIQNGKFTFEVDKMVRVATKTSDVFVEDSPMAQQVIASYVPKMTRALMSHFETSLFALQSTQTSGDSNTILGAAHRYFGSGTSNALAVDDFRRMSLAFDLASVPQSGRTAIIDVTAASQLVRDNTTAMTYNPMWEGLVSSGWRMTDMPVFRFNIHGFDVYVSNFIDQITTETIGGTTVTDLRANLFFNSREDANPFLYSWKRAPKVEEGRDMDEQCDKLLMTARYGVGVDKPEGLGVVLSKSSTN